MIILNNNPRYVSAVTKVVLKYYHGLTGELRAVSCIVTVRNPNADKVSTHGANTVLMHSGLCVYTRIGLKSMC